MTDKRMQGRRVADGTDPLTLKPGDYMKLPSGNWWLQCPPDGKMWGTLSPTIHKIEEHADGTITISPSIGIDKKKGGGWSWHGFLKKGIWTWDTP